MKLISEHLPEFDTQHRDEINHLRTQLGVFNEYVRLRMSEIAGELAGWETVDCPVCLQPTLYSDAGNSCCLFCNYHDDGVTAVHEWANVFKGFQSPKDSLIEPRVHLCPECGKKSCAAISEDDFGNANYKCFSCGYEGNFDFCVYCNELANITSGNGACSDCNEYRAGRSD